MAAMVRPRSPGTQEQFLHAAVAREEGRLRVLDRDGDRESPLRRGERRGGHPLVLLGSLEHQIVEAVEPLACRSAWSAAGRAWRKHERPRRCSSETFRPRTTVPSSHPTRHRPRPPARAGTRRGSRRTSRRRRGCSPRPAGKAPASERARERALGAADIASPVRAHEEERSLDRLEPGPDPSSEGGQVEVQRIPDVREAGAFDPRCLGPGTDREAREVLRRRGVRRHAADQERPDARGSAPPRARARPARAAVHPGARRGPGVRRPRAGARNGPSTRCPPSTHREPRSPANSVRAGSAHRSG